ncbi:MAG: peptide-methionine (S)-S-oxide reductase MsrA [Gemmatimonadota bacterium]
MNRFHGNRSLMPSLGVLVILSLGHPAGSTVSEGTHSLKQQHSSAKATALFAGGCFWGVESVFEHVRGVRSATSGFAVPEAANGDSLPEYLEAVRVEYDSSQISYRQLLEIFFLVAHDPTQVDGQGPDIGPEYRSFIFPNDEGQRQAAQAYIDELRSSNAFRRPIATKIVALKRFKVAEESHQDYVVKNPYAPYVLTNDVPKLEELRRRFPAVFRGRA